MPSMGDKVLAGDFPQAKSAHDGTDELGFTSTTYIAGAAATVGVTFVAPTSGRIGIVWHARIESNTNSVRACVSVQVSTGGVIGSGTVVSAADDDSALETPQDATGGSNTRIQASMFRFVSGLTAGNTYNAITMHKMLSAGNADIFTRGITVFPLP